MADESGPATDAPGLHVRARGGGITAPLSRQVDLLGSILGDAVRRHDGEPMLDLVESLRRLCKSAETDDHVEARAEAERRIAALDVDRIAGLLRAYTVFFHLVNQAEKREIIRINRDRAIASRAAGARARRESIAEAIHALHRRGLDRAAALDLLRRLDIQPTLTAHPTEARRRTILQKQQRIAALLGTLQREATPAEEDAALHEIGSHVALLLATDEIRAERPTVRDEVEQGLYFLQGTIWEAVPEIHRDAERAFAECWGEPAELPAFLRFRSWIGGDRDGNPAVTPTSPAGRSPPIAAPPSPSMWTS